MFYFYQLLVLKSMSKIREKEFLECGRMLIWALKIQKLPGPQLPIARFTCMTPLHFIGNLWPQHLGPPLDQILNPHLLGLTIPIWRQFFIYLSGEHVPEISLLPNFRFLVLGADQGSEYPEQNRWAIRKIHQRVCDWKRQNEATSGPRDAEGPTRQVRQRYLILNNDHSRIYPVSILVHMHLIQMCDITLHHHHHY